MRDSAGSGVGSGVDIGVGRLKFTSSEYEWRGAQEERRAADEETRRDSSIS
jgi:hypothetical protein